MDIKKDDEIKIDPETGLPELPEGYRWNVTDEFPADGSYFGPTPTYKSTTRLRVILEESCLAFHTVEEPNSRYRWWNFEGPTILVRVDETKWTYRAGKETTEVSAQSILQAARFIMADLRRASEREALVGIYPPKRLEVEA